MPYYEVFEKNCAYYMALGMSYEDYWNGDCMMVKYYRQAERIRQRRANRDAWLQGRYVYDALLAVAPVLIPFNKNPKPSEYLKEPYPIDKEMVRDKEKRKMEEMKAKMLAKAKAINAKRKGGEQSG